jgi:RNA polymerase sigma-70 factor, ECF subfamily
MKTAWHEGSAHEAQGAFSVVNEQDPADIRGSLDGDGDAYARLVERHQDRVGARMWRFTRDRADHQELVQEVFVEAYTSLAGYRGSAPFEHWLARISTTVGYRFWKRQARERSRNSISIDDWDQVSGKAVESMGAVHAAQLLHELLDQLPPRDRLVLMLRYVEDRTVEETAALTGWTASMVKVQAWRARKKLKRLLEEAGVEVTR